MSSKRYKKLTEDSNTRGEIFLKLISEIKKNCTVKFDESIDLSLQIFNKQKTEKNLDLDISQVTFLIQRLKPYSKQSLFVVIDLIKFFLFTLPLAF